VSNLRRNYRDQIVQLMDRLLAEEASELDAARDAIAGALRRDKLIHVAGTGHSHLLALEVFYRAGGIAAVKPMLDEDLMLHKGAERSTYLERDAAKAIKAVQSASVKPGDVVIVASNSGRNGYPVELAILAKEAGAVLIAVTSRQHTEMVESRHSSGKRLFEVADIVLDNGGVPGDACLAIPGHTASMCPTSSIIGMWLLNSLLAEAVEMLASDGILVDVWQSANSSEGSGNADILGRWKQRVSSL
jgi:uncharacterized phosphosugar-binding protein